MAGAKDDKFDLMGSLIYSLMLVTVMYGFSILPDIEGLGLVLAGIVTFLFLIKWESKVKCPV